MSCLPKKLLLIGRVWRRPLVDALDSSLKNSNITVHVNTTSFTDFCETGSYYMAKITKEIDEQRASLVASLVSSVSCAFSGPIS